MRSNVSGFKSENGLRRSIGNHRLPDSSSTGFRLLPIERALTVEDAHDKIQFVIIIFPLLIQISWTCKEVLYTSAAQMLYQIHIATKVGTFSLIMSIKVKKLF